MASRPLNIHAVVTKQNLDRGAFLAAFILGVFGGLLLKIAGSHPFVTSGYAAIILCAYAFVAWAGGRIKIEPEAIGDNCYYLGFLFTLSSLAFTLYQMADPTMNGGKPIDIPEVISGFGVALSSTIAGVFLRVFMMQMRPDFVAKDREVRADLNRSYSDFRKHLSGVMSQMKAFSTESIQYAAERDERMRVSTEKFATDHLDSFQVVADALAQNMEKTFSQAAKKAVEEISTSIQQTNKDSQIAIHELVADIQKTKQRFQEQEIQSFKDIQDSHKRLITELGSAEKRLKDHNTAMGDYIKVTRQTADAMNKRVIPALDKFKKRLDALPASDVSYDSADSTTGDLTSTANKPLLVKVKDALWVFGKRSDT